MEQVIALEKMIHGHPGMQTADVLHSAVGKLPNFENLRVYSYRWPTTSKFDGYGNDIPQG